MNSIFTNYHAHSSVNYFTDEVEEVVGAVTQSLFDAEELDSSEAENYRVLARKIESFLRMNPPRGWDVDGPLNPLMTKKLMHEVLTDTFAHLKETGQCITMSTYFKMTEQGHKFRKTDGNLSRVWGSNYVNEQFENSSEYKAALHYLVIPDTQDSIDVCIKIDPYNQCYPRVHQINDEGVMVISTFIEGCGIAPKCVSDSISKIGYTDFSGFGNIIQEDGTGIKYVVDTETKSFDCAKNYFPNYDQLKSEIRSVAPQRNNREYMRKLQCYLIDRWAALSKSPLEDQIFTIKI